MVNWSPAIQNAANMLSDTLTLTLTPRMGYALWLVPSCTEFTSLSELMKFRPQPYTLDSHSRSYPSFDPHITLTTFDVLPSSFNLDAIPLDNLNPPVAYFDSVKCGNNYLGALSIRISQSSKLMCLHEAVTRHLNMLNMQWKSRGFPHMSLFYVDEPDERKRLEAELKSSRADPIVRRGQIPQVDRQPNLAYDQPK
ncbi:uncharacterized protein EV420DRAFT_1635008 [Desarmillaria tabescens]|uniref:Uncharacterized protein n=1 Tax=Armillaria tabescens TaxID=1929756 RepID=A0AA39U650_ARMTA|nr:uncharacterized protein EV420DRAFT_1635008 [Desarmillaria tabescens]KAK0467745.1 hypothetical protein EV420DRAFT_1635008 [Desarmillaria tabescens]